MKTKKSFYLKKTNDRWKWMAGAAAATAAGVTASQANTITVTLSNDYISSSGGNHLYADLTGDGHPDLTLSAAYYTHRIASVGAQVFINGVYANVRATAASAREILGSHVSTGGAYQIGFGSLSRAIPITFTDASINGGATTNGFVEVTVTGGPLFGKVQLDSFSYNTIVVPEPSSLALLAVGAGGVLAFRQRRKAAKNQSLS